MKKAIMILMTASLAGSGFAMAYAKSEKPAPEIRKIGEPKNCIQIRSISSTKIIDNQTIDFKMNGGKIMRNTLTNRCSGLKSADAFSYRTSLSRLCNVDMIRVLQSYGGSYHEGPGCGLGKFQEIEKVKPAAE